MDCKLCHPELGTFLLGREIGRGSFAVVYSATYTLCQCPVAVKIFDNRIWDDPEELEYAKKEFELQKSVNHPLIPKAHEMFVSNGRLCVIMELASFIMTAISSTCRVARVLKSHCSLSLI